MSLINLLQALTGSREMQSSDTGPGAQASPVSSIDVTASGNRNKPGPMMSMLPPQSSPDIAPGMSDPNFDKGAPQTASPARLNYNNSSDVRALNDAMSAEGTPRGGMANPGLYGILPQGMQHGVLRNALGALGDAFLVGSGRQAAYEPRMERQEEGQALVGMNINDPDSVATATQRLASTGAAGSPELANKYEEQAQQAALRKATMEQTGVYRQGLQQDRENGLAARQSTMMNGLVSGAKDAVDYAQRYQMADRRAKQIDPNSDAASMFGIPRPEEWNPTLAYQYGASTGQQITSTDKAASRGVTMRGQDIGANSRIEAARINAGSRQPTQAGFDEHLQQRWDESENGGRPLSQGEKAAIDKRFGRSRSQRPAITAPDTTSVGAQLGALAGAKQKFQNNTVYTDAHGNHARYVNGKFIPVK